MGFHTDDLPLSSDFRPEEGEANFPPTITREVAGGAHIAPHCITVQDTDYILVDWADGLPRHDPPGTRAVRFPHGLIMFGESFEECARRLVDDQLGMTVSTMEVIHIYSSVDEASQWHIEPLLLVNVTGSPHPPVGASAIRHPVGPTLPAGGVWRGKPSFDSTYHKYIHNRL